MLSSSPMMLAFAESRTARHSRLSHHPLPMGCAFRGFAGSLSLRPVDLLASLADLTGLFTQPTETFTPELSTGRSPCPRSGITTVVTEQVPPVGLTPTGTSTSIAAPALRTPANPWDTRASLCVECPKARAKGDISTLPGGRLFYLTIPATSVKVLPDQIKAVRPTMRDKRPTAVSEPRAEAFKTRPCSQGGK